jgi:hypothetical protein
VADTAGRPAKLQFRPSWQIYGRSQYTSMVATPAPAPAPASAPAPAPAPPKPATKARPPPPAEVTAVPCPGPALGGSSLFIVRGQASTPAHAPARDPLPAPSPKPKPKRDARKKAEAPEIPRTEPFMLMTRQDVLSAGLLDVLDAEFDEMVSTPHGGKYEQQRRKQMKAFGVRALVPSWRGQGEDSDRC